MTQSDNIPLFAPTSNTIFFQGLINQTGIVGGTDEFLLGLNSSAAPLYGTYVGGSSADHPYGIDIQNVPDNNNKYNLLLVGSTSSKNYVNHDYIPFSGIAYYEPSKAQNSQLDAFITNFTSSVSPSSPFREIENNNLINEFKFEECEFEAFANSMSLTILKSQNCCSDAIVNIYNLMGQKMLFPASIDNGLTFDIYDIVGGMYLIIISCDSISYSLKFIKN